ncbi:ribbon-helix-helix domain-containing protein [Bdellovibrionota bacterium FG-1]
MKSAKIAISLNQKTLNRVDRLVKRKVFASRSAAIQSALEMDLDRRERNRLAEEFAKLDPQAEAAMAEEGLEEDLKQWPEY